MKDTFSLIKEIFQYLNKTKKWWLIPLALLIIIIGLVILLMASSPVPVFIYPLI
jgi:flagellar biosynthesis/type III secretory pathway M-ring protein FliF/YscJ